MDLAGSRLGKYELDSEIGRGDLGAVYKGQDPDVARSVAIKVLSSRQATRDDAERFLRTVRAAARLNHPNIVNIYDIGKSDDWFFYVMEYLDGQSLSELLLERGPLGTEEAQLLLRQMAAALDHAHAQGIVHRWTEDAPGQYGQRERDLETAMRDVAGVAANALTCTGNRREALKDIIGKCGAAMGPPA